MMYRVQPDGVAQIDVSEHHPCEVSTGKVCRPDFRAVQIGPTELRAVHLGAIENRSAEVAPPKYPWLRSALVSSAAEHGSSKSGVRRTARSALSKFVSNTFRPAIPFFSIPREPH
jgi:hypothetical protein